jgi:hypothetical protein
LQAHEYYKASENANLHSLCIHVEKNNQCGDDANVSSSRIDFGYISKQSSNQFYGYCLLMSILIYLKKILIELNI